MRISGLIIILFALISCTESTNITGESSIPAGAEVVDFDDMPGLQKATIYNGAQISEQGEYYQGQRTGTWTEYHASTGSVKSVTTYINGVKEGLFIQLNDQGALEEKLNFHNSLPHGQYVKYKRGRIVEEREYQYGQLNGAVKKFYDNGTIMEESQFSMGTRNGMARWYDQEGNMTIEYEYVNGELVKDEE